MGITGLSRLIADCAPDAVKEQDVGSYFGRKIAIDASMAIYQFLIAIRHTNQMMTNDQGETTSHLVGMFYRTCKMLESGVKPIYVFDGKAPELKSGELEKRKERRKQAEQMLSEAKTAEEEAKFNKRLVRVTRQHNEDCKRLLTLLGCPIVSAPSEAEAQCAQLCKEGLVYGIATEDMDGLTFATPRLIRNLSTGRSDDKAKEYNFEKILQQLQLTYDQFIDLCILMGCDYCESIKGIGGKKGLELIRQYGSIEEILRAKFGVTEFLDCELSYKDKIEQVEQPENEDEKANTEMLTEDKPKVKEEEKNEENVNNSDEDKASADEHQVESKVEHSSEKMSSPMKEVKQEANEDHATDEEGEKGKDESCIADAEIQVDESEDGENEKDEVENRPQKVKNNKANPVPENWLFRGARQLFKQPNVISNKLTDADLRFRDVDEEGLIQFLCHENGFSKDRILPSIKRVKYAKGKANQSRIDTFFKVMPSNKTSALPSSSSKKRPSSGSATHSKRGRRPK